MAISATKGIRNNAHIDRCVSYGKETPDAFS